MSKITGKFYRLSPSSSNILKTGPLKGLVYYEYEETYVPNYRSTDACSYITKRIRQVFTGKSLLFVDRVSADKNPPKKSKYTYIIDPRDFTYIRMRSV